jgi:hypothetical protein
MLHFHHRVVPINTLIHVILGNTYSVIGFIFVAFSWIFCVIFIGSMDTSSFSFSDDSPITQGIVSNIEETSSSENKRRIYAYTFDYQANRRKYSDISYQSNSNVNVGDTVQVEYLADKPEVARIQGMRRSEFGMTVLFVLIFPIIGWIFAGLGIQKGLSFVKLLKHGELTTGKLISSEPTSTRINNRTVYKMSFEFTTKEGKKYNAVANTHLTELLEDEEREQILYMPDNPEKSTALDGMTGSPRLKNDNEWQAMDGGKALLYAIPPVIFVLELILTFVF